VTFPPDINAPMVFMATVGINSTYSFMVTDSMTVNIMVNGQFDLPPNVNLIVMSSEEYVLTWTPLDIGDELNITIVATGSGNVLSAFSPRVQLCGCINNGICTETGILNLQLPFIVLNCDCPTGRMFYLCYHSLLIMSVSAAYDGDFCENDADGCAMTSCQEGQMCIDNVAPLSGAVCTCPDGYATSDSKCDGM